MNSPAALLSGKIDRRRRAFAPAVTDFLNQSDWPTWLSQWPMSTRCSPSALNAIVALFSQSSSNPTPPIAGVGRIADPPPVALLSL